jgi:transposase
LAARSVLKVLAAQYSAIGADIASISKSILAWYHSCEPSRRLEEIPGIGPIVATALVAEIGDWNAFSSGRGLAAWIGLVPKQHTTGGKDKLGSITKQGNRYLRRLGQRTSSAGFRLESVPRRALGPAANTCRTNGPDT